MWLWLAACGSEAEKSAEGQAAATDSVGMAAAAAVRQVVGIAIVEPSARIVRLTPEQSGYIREVKVNIGDKVSKNQVLVVLDAEVERAQVGQASAKAATQNEAIAAARENLRLLEVKLGKARADLARNEALFAGNALTQQQLDDSRALTADLSQQLRVQEAALREQQRRLGEAQADVGYFQTLADQKVVRSPINGAVLSLDARVGEYLSAQTAIGEFAPEGPVMALTEIDEMFADRVRVGQRAFVRAQGSREVITTGTVVLASPYLRKKSLFADKAGDLEDRRVREVRVQLDQPEKLLLGARVECVIEIE
jgi:multidrug resistance efflux pump